MFWHDEDEDKYEDEGEGDDEGDGEGDDEGDDEGDGEGDDEMIMLMKRMMKMMKMMMMMIELRMCSCWSLNLAETIVGLLNKKKSKYSQIILPFLVAFDVINKKLRYFLFVNVIVVCFNNVFCIKVKNIAISCLSSQMLLEDLAFPWKMKLISNNIIAVSWWSP